MVLNHVIKLQKKKKQPTLAAHWSIKSNPTSPTKSQIVIFEVFNNAMPEFSEMNTNAVSPIFQKFNNLCTCDW